MASIAWIPKGHSPCKGLYPVETVVFSGTGSFAKPIVFFVGSWLISFRFSWRRCLGRSTRKKMAVSFFFGGPFLLYHRFVDSISTTALLQTAKKEQKKSKPHGRPVSAEDTEIHEYLYAPLPKNCQAEPQIRDPSGPNRRGPSPLRWFGGRT